MAESGCESTAYMAGFDLSQFIKSFGLTFNKETGETTNMRSDCNKEFVGLLKMASVNFDGFYTKETDGSDDITETFLGDPDTPFLIFPAGDNAVGDSGYAFDGLPDSKSTTSEVADVVVFAYAAQKNGSVDRVLTQHPFTQETASGSEAAINNGSSSPDGVAFYVVVDGFTPSGGAPQIDVILEESTTGAFAGEEVAISTISAVADNFEGSAVIAGTIAQYLRVRFVLTDLTDVTFHASAGRR